MQISESKISNEYEINIFNIYIYIYIYHVSVLI